MKVLKEGRSEQGTPDFFGTQVKCQTCDFEGEVEKDDGIDRDGDGRYFVPCPNCGRHLYPRLKRKADGERREVML